MLLKTRATSKTYPSLTADCWRRWVQLRSIKKSLAEESDPEQRKHTANLLINARRKLAAHRESLEALRTNPYAGPELEERLRTLSMELPR